MNKKLSLVILGLALASVIVVALNGLSPEQREIFNECKKNCSTNKMLDMRACNDVSFECRNECRGDWKNLSQINRDTFNSCTAGCELNLSSNLTKQEKNNLIQECRRNCSAAKGIDRQESYADYRNCTRTCQDDKLNCKKAAIEDSLSCKQECTAIASNFTSGNVSIEKTHCPRPRPNDCSNESQPVCNNRNMTYINGCFACEDRNTSWYEEGSCA